MSEQVGQARITLRGIGVDNISTGAEGSVAFNQDGVFYSRSTAALASFYDVNRIEVLRGPQGTLYGRNATGGSVNIITNQPTSEFHGALNLTGGNHETVNSDGFINGALSSTVAGRLSFQTQHHDGYGKNLVTGDDVDNKNSYAFRGQLLFTPGDKWKILAGGDYYNFRDHSNGYHYFGPDGHTAGGAPITPTAILLGGYAASNPRDIANPQNPYSHGQYYGGRIDVSYLASDSVTLRSLTAYRHTVFETGADVSPFSIQLSPVIENEKSDQYSQEFQVNVDTERNKLVAGLFYLHETIVGELDVPFNLLALGGPDFFTQGFQGPGRLNTDAVAGYAQDTYSVTKRLRLTIGGRYSWERKGVYDFSDFDLTRPFSRSNPPRFPPQIERSVFKSFTPKFGIDFDITPAVLVYASYSEGFKAGTYNLGANTPALRPETVTAYETGLKSTFANGRVRANLAGFYYDYKNLQVGKVQGVQLCSENAAPRGSTASKRSLPLSPSRILR